MEDFVAFKKNRIMESMENHKLSLLIASLPENIYYLSGFQSMSQRILNRVDAFYVFHADRDVGSLIIPCSEVPTAYEQLEKVNIYCYGTFFFRFPQDPKVGRIKETIARSYNSSAHALIQSIKDAGVKRGVIGLDEMRIRPAMWKQIDDHFQDLQFVPASGIFSQIRTIKHEEEIVRLEKAAEIAEQALFGAVSELKVGMTEEEIAQTYMNRVTISGGTPYFNVVTANLRSAFVDTINTRNRIKERSILRFDIGCVYEGYRSDIARTAIIGETSDKVERYYSAILKGEELAISYIKSAISAEKIFDVAVQTVKKGIPHFQRHHCGHGIGLEIYDPPSIAPGVKDPLETGMVLCIETPYYELGWGGVQVEDTVVVTENGHRYLTKSSRELIRIAL